MTALSSLQATLQTGQALLLSRPGDLFYFCSLQASQTEREAFAFVTRTKCLVLHSPLLHSQKRRDITSIAHLRQAEWQTAVQWLKRAHVADLLVDEADLRVSELHHLESVLVQTTISIKAQDRALVWQLRMIKTARELKIMQKAGQIAAQALVRLHHELKIGMTELDAVRLLEQIMGELGANAPAFPTIVAFDSHTANPHHIPGKTALAPEMPVLIDCGAQFEGYCSDLTRTIWFGTTPSHDFLYLENIVTTAYALGTDQLLHPPQDPAELTGHSLDNAVRAHIEANEHGAHFIHTTGHGVGIAIHEPPSCSPQDKTPLRPGMALTIEPGIYLPGKIGYRHENTLVLKKKGFSNLTDTTPFSYLSDRA